MHELFDAATMAEMRRINDDNLPHTATVLRLVETAGAGASMRAGVWTPTEATYRCRLAAYRPTEQIERTRLAHRGVFVVVLPSTAIVDPKDRLRVVGETEGVPWSVDLAIDGVKAPGSYEMLRRVHGTDVGYTVRIVTPAEPIPEASFLQSFPFAVEVVDHGGAQLLGVPVEWAVDNTALASIDEAGVLRADTALGYDEVVVSARAGVSVERIGAEVVIDHRQVVMQASVTFTLSGVNGEYAAERHNLFAPAGFAFHRCRWIRRGAIPAGARIEIWALKTGGNPALDGDYTVLLSANIMTVLAFTSLTGPFRHTQLRMVSGATPGTLTIDGLAIKPEPAIDEATTTFNVPAIAGQLAPERLTLEPTGDLLISHVTIFNESPKVTSSTIEHWTLKPGGDPTNDGTPGKTDDYLFAESFLSSATARVANVMPALETFQMRVRSGGPGGQLTSHGIATPKLGPYEPPHALTV